MFTHVLDDSNIIISILPVDSVLVALVDVGDGGAGGGGGGGHVIGADLLRRDVIAQTVIGRL